MYTYNFDDVAGQSAVQNFESSLRTFTFFYDSDILISGGVGVQFKDYLVTVTGTVGFGVESTVST